MQTTRQPTPSLGERKIPLLHICVTIYPLLGQSHTVLSRVFLTSICFWRASLMSNTESQATT